MMVQDPFSGLVFEVSVYKGFNKAMIYVAAVWGKKAWKPDVVPSQTPWQELQRKFVGQLASGACLDFAVNYQKIAKTKGVPRHSH